MYDRTEDQALLARIIDGDRVALELLYRRHAHWLTARLQSRCGDPELADLAVQDTFLAVWKSAKSARPRPESKSSTAAIQKAIRLFLRRRA